MRGFRQGSGLRQGLLAAAGRSWRSRGRSWRSSLPPLRAASARSPSARWSAANTDRRHCPAAARRLMILRHPVYAGAYVFGRTTQRTQVVDGRARRTTGHSKPMTAWNVLLRDHHPGYITWEQLRGHHRGRWRDRDSASGREPCRPCENAFGSEVNVFRRPDNAMQARRSVEASFATTGPVARTDTHSGSV